MKWIEALALLVWSSACVRGVRAPTPPLGASRPPPVVTQTLGDVRVHAIRTGWVSVKEVHRDYGGPDALRMPAILVDGQWTEYQLRARRIAAIVEEPDLARASLDRIAAQLALGPTYLAPAHDAAALERLARGEPTPP